MAIIPPANALKAAKAAQERNLPAAVDYVNRQIADRAAAGFTSVHITYDAIKNAIGNFNSMKLNGILLVAGYKINVECGSLGIYWDDVK